MTSLASVKNSDSFATSNIQSFSNSSTPDQISIWSEHYAYFLFIMTNLNSNAVPYMANGIARKNNLEYLMFIFILQPVQKMNPDGMNNW